MSVYFHNYLQNYPLVFPLFSAQNSKFLQFQRPKTRLEAQKVDFFFNIVRIKRTYIKNKLN